MNAPKKLLILTSNTGGGHRSAALALEESLYRNAEGPLQIRTTQVLEEATWASRKMADLYNYLLRYHQNWMKYYYWAINTFKPNESKLILRRALKYGVALMEEYEPDMLVSVHPMTQHFFAYVLKKMKLTHKIPLVTVVTDPCYGFWEGWSCNTVQEYYVATDDAQMQLEDFGVDPKLIHEVGMPVHARFHPVSEAERNLYRQDLGLVPDKFTVFVNAGWVGGGNIPRIMQVLSEAQLDIQAIFLAGKNPDLIAYGESLAQSACFPMHVMGYAESLHHVMAASDVMVSKLGGLTTFEALACQLPIIADVITPPMPQEAQTGMYIERTGTGILLSRPEAIVSVVQSLIHSPTRFQAMRQAALQFGKAGAVDRISDRILDILYEVPDQHLLLQSAPNSLRQSRLG
jgi:processive 1,2-diacylglycerol beta-glucosyltransferase